MSLDETLVSHMNRPEFLFNVADWKWKGKKEKRVRKKEPPLIYRSLAGTACQNIPRKRSGKMTQAALALSGTVVLARAHYKLEPIFPLLSCFEGGKWQRAGQEMAKEEEVERNG